APRETRREAGEALVGDQDIRALADHRHPDTRLAYGLGHRDQIGLGLRFQEERGRPADPERGKRRELEPRADPLAARRPQDRLRPADRAVRAVPGRHGAPPIRSSAAWPSLHTSPPPIVRTRSPWRTSRARNSTTSFRWGRYTTRRLRPVRAMP